MSSGLRKNQRKPQIRLQEDGAVKPVDEDFSSYNSSTTIVGVITPREKLRAWLLFLRPTSARNVDVDTTQEVL